MTIAYLVNQYPKVSHSFIRREIEAVAASGLTVHRYAIRSLAAELVDEADLRELVQTQFVLDVGPLGLLLAWFWLALTQPRRFGVALQLAWAVGHCSERGRLIHLIYLAEACVLRRWCRRDGVAHIHAHFGTNSTTVAMLVQALGGPSYSFTVHGPEEFDKVQAIALPQKIERAAFVVAVSDFGRSQLCRWCSHELWDKIHVVRCGVDELFLQQAPLPLPLAPSFVCVGRLCEQKGHLLLIEAAAKLASQGGHFRLVLVGDGPLRTSIEALISRYGLAEQITITGWASGEEVLRHLLEAQVMVLPSFAEGLPVSLMEALALGRPVISTYVAGIPELVEPGVCGWLAPAGALEPLVAAMKSALETPVAELEEMGQRGAKRVAQQHSSATEGAKLAALFRQQLEQS